MIEITFNHVGSYLLGAGFGWLVTWLYFRFRSSDKEKSK